MSVLIKGMEMPENCDVCRFVKWSNLHQTSACKLNNYEPGFPDFSSDYKKQRSKICQLVELPEHHGRLIDVDTTCADFDTVNPKYQYWIDWAKRCVEAQPTVMEAE